MLQATGAVLAGASLSGCLAGGLVGSNDGRTAGDRTKADATVKVGSGGNLSFEPEALTVHPGQTVAWEWRSNNHNIVVEDQPGGADWKGTPGSSSEIYNDGYRYTHTFETVGEYEYFCQPHEAAGMTGSVTVSPEGANGKTTETTTDGKPPATADDLPVEVAPNDEYGFRPGTERPLKVPAGTEVTFV